MSTPNLPHTENLTPLYELVLQLQLLVNESVTIKDSIAGSIDTLSVKINQEPLQNKEKTLQQLKARNSQLKTELAQKAHYTRIITSLINNYELAIQAVLENTRNDVVDYNIKLLGRNRDYFAQLYEKSSQEHAMYQQLVNRRLLVLQISEALRKLVKTIDDDILYRTLSPLTQSYELRTLRQVLAELSDKKKKLRGKQSPVVAL